MMTTTWHTDFASTKAEQPCEAYIGNVCTGFGDSDQTCIFCRWQRDEHPSEQIRIGDDA